MSASDTWLTPDEVGELTGCLRSWKAQSRRLAVMGIKFRANGVGRPLVERAAVLGAKHSGGGSSAKPAEPNWAAMKVKRGKAA